MKLPLMVSLQTFLGITKPPEPTVSQTGVQARAIRHLIATGWIDARTVQRMGTTDPRKMFTRMRRMGLLHDANDARGFVLVKNNSRRGEHRLHKWTGKVPTSWEKPKTERRQRQRGGCR